MLFEIENLTAARFVLNIYARYIRVFVLVELGNNARDALKYAFLPAVSNCLTTYCHIRNANRSSTLTPLVFFFFRLDTRRIHRTTR